MTRRSARSRTRDVASNKCYNFEVRARVKVRTNAKNKPHVLCRRGVPKPTPHTKCQKIGLSATRTSRTLCWASRAVTQVIIVQNRSSKFSTSVRLMWGSLKSRSRSGHKSKEILSDKIEVCIHAIWRVLWICLGVKFDDDS